jgi:DNA-binding PadR family transcriptional regulator
MAEVRITNLVRFYAALLLHSRPMHGYELLKEIGSRTGRRISASQIYPFLAALRRGGYLNSKALGKREKRVYYLTAKGRRFVAAMLGRFGGLIEIAVAPKLTRCSHCGCEVYAGGYSARIGGKRRTFCCSHCAKAFQH